MNSSSRILQLPVEILLEIFTILLSQHSYTKNFFGHNDEKRCRYLSPKHCLYPAQTVYRYFRYGEDGTCICWQLDLLSISMVCKGWNFICRDLLKKEPQWLHLVNLPTFKRTYPFRLQIVRLLKESYSTNLEARQQVKRLMIDFASFDKQKDQNIFELFELCPRITQLDIVFDSAFHHNASHIMSRAQLLRDMLVKHDIAHRIKSLKFTSHPLLYNCPCCAGKGWDHHLIPVIDCLSSLRTLALHSVLPTRSVFEKLVLNSNLTHVVFHRAILPVHDKNVLVNNIPKQLWYNAKKIDIYENAGDAHLWTEGEYMNQLGSYANLQLERFTLNFNSAEKKGDPCLQE